MAQLTFTSLALVGESRSDEINENNIPAGLMAELSVIILTCSPHIPSARTVLSTYPQHTKCKVHNNIIAIEQLSCVKNRS